jgi:hypothetical protein
MAGKGFIFLTFHVLKKIHETLKPFMKSSKFHEYSDVFMNIDNHECLGSDPADKLAWLGVTANLNETRVSVMSEWQEISLNYTMSNMYWQLGVCALSFGCSTDDGFTIYLNNTVVCGEYSSCVR